MKLQFKHQPFQEEAAAAVCDVFKGQPLYNAASYRMDLGDTSNMQQNMTLSEVGFCNHALVPELTTSQLTENLRAVQMQNGLKPDDRLAGPGLNLSIEMETGTGKTYTYLKTMYELNKRYGWSKFIVVVPSVAIREGVNKSLETMKEHFKLEYGFAAQHFIYSSDDLPRLDSFASSPSIQVMIINMQAFNSSKNQRIIDKELDSFRSRRPMDVIAKTNPILIIDEPQSVEGKQTKESLKKFNPLFTLRYSATHRETYNMVYRLDAMDAYNQHLVKKIAVLGVTLTGTTATGGYVYLEGIDLYPNRAPTARLGFELKGANGTRTVVQKVKGGDNLYDLSNHLAEYADRYVILPDGIDGRDNSVTFLNGLKLYVGQIQGNENLVDAQRRVQIRETIRTHLQKERELYSKGIKVLSLFFIDEVGKYRMYEGEDDSGRNGEYAKMFEEEYTSLLSDWQRKMGDEAWFDYVSKISVRKTHQGYFSIDKKKGKKARFVEGKVDKKTGISDDTDAYDLIMKDKERLLSLDEPVRFIFSHSALREGWDNPNVFQICTLKPQSDSEIRSRQEIGRGLRLCVNQNGERMDESVLGADVQELNKLTLITDMDFGKFAEALQAGLAESLSNRPKVVDVSLFANRILTNENGAKLNLTPTIAQAVYDDLISNGYVHRGELTAKYYEERRAGTLQLAPEVQGFAPAVGRLLDSVYDSHALMPENAQENNVQATVDPEKLKRKEFLQLWERINHKSFYTVQLDTQELIEKSIRELNDKLKVSKVLIKIEAGEQTAKIDSRQQLEQGEAFKRSKADDKTTAQGVSLGSVRYDLVGKLVEETQLTRATVAAILQGMAAPVFAQYRQNPEEFILKTAKLINNQKATQIIEHISYNKLKDTYSTDIFTQKNLHGKLGLNAMEAHRSLFSYVIYDSENEKRFASDLEINEKVALYIKLPGAFFISTPVGKYNPDWAIAFREGEVQHVYFVAETKGVDLLDGLELRGVEQAKIACAKAHFAAISNQSVVYDVVDSFDKLMQIVT